MNKAETTRKMILEKAFDLIYRNGYQSTSIDEIIIVADLSKGAFYYHFKSKEEMGLAILNEIIYPNMNRCFVEPLKRSLNPTEDIYRSINDFLLSRTDKQIKHGCPTNNLIQELAANNKSFNKALHKLLLSWQSGIQEALEKGIQQSKIRKDIDTEGASKFIIASYEGLRNLGKVYQNKAYYKQYLVQLKNYLGSLI